MVVKNGTPISKDDYKDTDVNVNFYYATATYIYPAYNHKGEINVTKQFINADGSSLNKALSGTYQFGLFAAPVTPESAATPEKVTYATYSYGNLTVAAVFTDVELDKDYYVYELDDKGTPIQPNQPGTVSGIPFVVNYDKTQLQVTAGNPTASVTVTNRINYPELPQTGGVGTGVFRVSGAAAALLAGIILAGREGRKRKRRENHET